MNVTVSQSLEELGPPTSKVTERHCRVLNEVDESGQSESVKRPLDLLKEEDIVDMEREFTLHLDCDPGKKVQFTHIKFIQKDL